METAITRLQAEVEAATEGHPDRAEKLDTLGHFLNIQYEQAGNLHDLEAAIAHSEAAVEATPESHPELAQRLNNLGHRLSSRYERTGNLQDLEAAIARSEAAVEATAVDQPERAARLNNLGAHLSSRYQRTGNLEDLEAAIARSQAAVEAIPEESPNRAGLLNSLASHLSSRYQRTGNLEDLEAVIARPQATVEATPEKYPDRAARLSNHGIYVNRRYERGGDLEDLKAALAAHIASWRAPTAPILTRMQSALRAAKMMVFSPLEKDLPGACSLLRDAIHLVSLATSRSLEREDQQYILGQLNGLASLAASVSLEAGESPLEALRLQGLGRNIIHGQLLDYRSDISDLVEHHPTLAADFDSLRQDLDSPLPSLQSSDMSMNEQLQAQQSAIRRRNQVARDFDNLLLQIRQKSGFENFLRGESEANLLSAAQEGPIVVLNVTELRSDAILVTTAQVRSIALPNLSHALMIKYCSPSNDTDNNEVKREMLEWLWKAAVQPVLQELGFYPRPRKVDGQPPVDPLPRIWWIGVGLMAKAPIHAAATFHKGRVNVQMTTLQHCLPSYISSIRYVTSYLTLSCQQPYT